MGDRNDSKKQNEISVVELFVNAALWALIHGNSALQKLQLKLQIFVGGCFPLPTYRN